MLEIITWYWKPASDYRTQFSVENVNILQRMVARHYPHPHRFSCVTDQMEGFNENVRVIPLWDDHRSRPSIYGPGTPSCYPRLRAFSQEAAKIIGPRFISLDLDVVICGDVSPIFNRPEEFLIWGDDERRTPYNGSMWMMTAGCKSFVWERFNANPERAIAKARGAGFYGSDQAWMCYALGPAMPRWTRHDGVYSYRMHVKTNAGKLPKDARIVFFEGHYDPWSPACRKAAPWIEQHYC